MFGRFEYCRICSDNLTLVLPRAGRVVPVARNTEYDAEVRRHASELVAQAIRTTEDRVAEVKRKAGEIPCCICSRGGGSK